MANIEIKVTFNGPALDESTIKEAFKEHGKVKKCVIREWGGAFVTMKDQDEGKSAIVALNGIEISGCKLTVREKEPHNPDTVRRAALPLQSAAVNTFVNPYNFIPVQKVNEKAVRAFHSEDNHWQERFRGDEYSSGRIVCEIETESEIFIGAGVSEGPISLGDNKGTPAKVEPYELGKKPAIPPTSLKGMISSVMEAASNSALRVLDKSVYTRRMDFQTEMLKDIGLIVRSNHIGGTDALYIMPIKTGEPIRKAPALVDESYPIYLNGYDRKRKRAIGLLGSADSPKDFSAAPEYYYLDTRLIRPKMSKGVWFIGYEFDPAAKAPVIITKNNFSRLNPTEQAYFRKGIYKILGIGPDREEQIPGNKTHEFFLLTHGKNQTASLLPIGKDAISDFHAISDDRSSSNKSFATEAAWLPYSPMGRERQDEKGKDVLRIRENDVMYYNKRGNVVSKLSFSACWRNFCGNTKDKNDAYGYFRQVDNNGFLLPPCVVNQKNAATDPTQFKLKLTPACALMGFVEEEKGKDQPFASALAGRLFFSPGILSPGQDAETVRGDEKTLKILDSPKPPCPEFYFQKQNAPTHFTTKVELNPDGNYLPNGRKYYWHHHNTSDPYAKDKAYWEKHYKQCLTIKPIHEKTKFLFSIDFFNLSEFELGMLLYALRPNDAFRHLIGMGKPIGLGKIRIDILNLLFVDRNERYSKDHLFDEFFFHSHTNHAVGKIENLTQAFEKDGRGNFDAVRFGADAKVVSDKNVESFVKTFKKQMQEWYNDDKYFDSLEGMGDPVATQGLIVRYPPNPTEPDGFDEAYKWWMRNAGKEKGITGSKKPLPPTLAGTGNKAPVLPVNPSSL